MTTVSMQSVDRCILLPGKACLSIARQLVSLKESMLRIQPLEISTYRHLETPLIWFWCIALLTSRIQKNTKGSSIGQSRYANCLELTDSQSRHHTGILYLCYSRRCFHIWWTTVTTISRTNMFRQTNLKWIALQLRAAATKGGGR